MPPNQAIKIGKKYVATARAIDISGCPDHVPPDPELLSVPLGGDVGLIPPSPPPPLFGPCVTLSSPSPCTFTSTSTFLSTGLLLVDDETPPPTSAVCPESSIVVGE